RRATCSSARTGTPSSASGNSATRATSRCSREHSDGCSPSRTSLASSRERRHPLRCARTSPPPPRGCRKPTTWSRSTKYSRADSCGSARWRLRDEQHDLAEAVTGLEVFERGHDVGQAVRVADGKDKLARGSLPSK